MEQDAVTEDHCSTSVAYLFHNSPEKAGRPKKHKDLCFLLLLDKILGTSFISIPPLVLLSSIQMSPLSLDAISKSFCYTNLKNNMR